MAEPAESAEARISAPLFRFAEGSHLAQPDRVAGVSSIAIDDLLLRMRAGDRDAAADFLMRYGSRIRRRIRGKLGPDIRRLFDSLDIISTLGRRLDLYVMSGRLQAQSEAQLWALLFKMADNALIDKARIFRRLHSIEGEDGEFAQQLAVRLRQAEGKSSTGAEIEIDNCLRAVTDPIDRHILSLWLTGEPFTEIAEIVELAPTAVRKRWEKIKGSLRERFQSGLE